MGLLCTNIQLASAISMINYRSNEVNNYNRRNVANTVINFCKKETILCNLNTCFLP